MNKIVKYTASITALTIVAYVGWVVLETLFPIEEWFQQNPGWKTIFSILLVVGVIGIISAAVTQKGKQF